MGFLVTSRMEACVCFSALLLLDWFFFQPIVRFLSTVVLANDNGKSACMIGTTVLVCTFG